MSLINIGKSALLSYQRSLATIGHNIGNVATLGFSRQRTNLSSIEGARYSSQTGQGVNVDSIKRSFDYLLKKQSDIANSNNSFDKIKSEFLNKLESIFASGENGLGETINDIFNSFSDIKNAPTDSAVRNVVITKMKDFINRINNADSSFKELENLTKDKLTDNIRQVNELAKQIADLNREIVSFKSSGQEPNDLLDKRDYLIQNLQELISVNQIENEDGSIDLFIASFPLVNGKESGELSLNNSEEDPNKLVLNFKLKGEQKPLELDFDFNGEIGGLLAFQKDLNDGKNLMARLTVVVATELNNQNKIGLDLNGKIGKNLFDFKSENFGSSNVKGTKTTIINCRNLNPSDYKMILEGNNPKLIRLNDGKIFELKKDKDGNINSEIDGLNFYVPNEIVNQKKNILFQPYNKVLGEIKSVINNPEDLAIANSITSEIKSKSLKLNYLKINNSKDIPDLKKPITIKFDNKGNYSYGDGKWQKFESDKELNINGIKISLNGNPKSGDKIIISNALDLGEGFKLNSDNAKGFLDLRDEMSFDKGTSLINGFASALAIIATRTQSANFQAEVSSKIAEELQNNSDSISGVNLDEEYANLLSYQQAYQASAQIIQVAQSMFDSVLNAMNR